MAKPQPRKSEAHMRVTLTTIMAGPSGTALPGTVLELPQQQADALIAARSARPFDKSKDDKAAKGFTKAKVVEE